MRKLFQKEKTKKFKQDHNEIEILDMESSFQGIYAFK